MSSKSKAPKNPTIVSSSSNLLLKVKIPWNTKIHNEKFYTWPSTPPGFGPATAESGKKETK